MDLPDGKVAVLVVDESRDASVWVQFGVLFTLVLQLAEVEIDNLVVKPQFFESNESLPAGDC